MGTSELLPPLNAPAPTRSVIRTALVAIVAFAFALGSLIRLADFATTLVSSDATATVCKQAKPLVPRSALLADIDEHYASRDFVGQAAEWLGGAVRIPTESYDDMDAPYKDPRWAPFHDLHAYLEKQFPLVHSKFSLTKVDTLALVYTWAGSDPSLKPIFLAAHQDVVPVEPHTVDQWLQPPYSGLYDGEWVWGRGACDDKSGLIGIMISLETMISKGFTPRRTIVLGFGFDEETVGKGALAIAQHLLGQYGENSFSLIIDEGGGYVKDAGVVIAFPSVAEKGYLDVHVQVDTPGGHSSVPPTHTGIGILAALITEVEKHPEQPKLTRDSTTFEALQCEAEHAPDLPSPFRQAIKKAATSDKVLRQLEDYLVQDPGIRSLLSTTQAVDLIGGGVKVNALPEQAWAVINHRIAADSSVGALQRRLVRIADPIAQRFNVSLVAFGETVRAGDESAGTITLSDAYGSALEPAPRTPTDDAAAPYRLLSGTIRAAYRATPDFRARDPDIDVIVAPGMSTGNTDTKRYWALTRHIFRYNHLTFGDIYNGAHTINEALRATALPKVAQFYSYLILNADESDSLD